MSDSVRYFPWHDDVRQQLHTAATTDHLPHALLFNIEPGCGHEVFIEDFSKYLLCLEQQDNSVACGRCRSCEVFQSAAHPDFMRITTPEDKQIINVDQIRGLNHFLELSCSYSPARVAIINGAETMNVNAANSLLKSLEEPSDYTHIILVSTKARDLLPTIRSRCQQIRLPIPTQQAAINWLEAQELASDQSVDALLTIASGRPLYAATLSSGELPAQQEAWGVQLLGVLQGKLAMSAVSADWAKQGRGELLDWQLRLVQSMLRQSFLEEGSKSYGETHENLRLILNGRNLWAMNDGLLKLKALSTHPLNAQLFAENMLSLWQK